MIFRCVASLQVTISLITYRLTHSRHRDPKTLNQSLQRFYKSSSAIPFNHNPPSPSPPDTTQPTKIKSYQTLQSFTLLAF